MKMVSYNAEDSAGVCPILEDADLDAMTDDELREQRDMWRMSAGDDDPLAYAVESNYRLVERHIELRAVGDDALSGGLERARWNIQHYREGYSGSVESWLIERIVRHAKIDAADF